MIVSPIISQVLRKRKNNLEDSLSKEEKEDTEIARKLANYITITSEAIITIAGLGYAAYSFGQGPAYAIRAVIQP